VTGVVGAQLATSVILILGLANLLADGFSMAAGNFSATKTERDRHAKLRQVEHDHIAQSPEGEREEVRQILEKQGLRGTTLEDAVASVTSDKERWIRLMLQEEYGLSDVVHSPLKAALYTFASFAVCGAVPLIPFILALDHPFLISAVTTGLVFAAIGALKSRWSPDPAWYCALETLAIGAAAASLAYLVGDLLGDLGRP